MRLCHQLYHVFIWVISFISYFWIYLIEFILWRLDDWLSNRLVIFFLNDRLDILPKNLSGIRVILLVFMQNNLHILIFIFLDLNYLVILILLILQSLFNSYLTFNIIIWIITFALVFIWILIILEKILSNVISKLIIHFFILIQCVLLHFFNLYILYEI